MILACKQGWINKGSKKCYSTLNLLNDCNNWKKLLQNLLKIVCILYIFVIKNYYLKKTHSIYEQTNNMIFFERVKND